MKPLRLAVPDAAGPHPDHRVSHPRDATADRPIMTPAQRHAREGIGHHVHVGRQPIYEASGALFGYELLFRDQSLSANAAEGGAGATSRVITNAFTQFGLQQLVGDHHCFLNLTAEFVTGTLPLPFDPGRVVLEILETIKVDDDVVSGVARLAEAGHTIALDDFVLGGPHERLLPLAHVVKMDWSLNSSDELERAVDRFHSLGLRVVAERLEEDADVALARRLGFDLLQGYALARPATVSLEVLDTGVLRRLELLAGLNAADIELDRVVSLIATDPSLGLRVLQATNSAAIGLRRRVSSVREAILILGPARVRQWVTLMIASDACGAGEEHLARLVTRARMCHIVAEHRGVSGDAAFTVGMLSGIADTLLEPVEELVSRLPLSETVGTALISRTGPLGTVLDQVLTYESGAPITDLPGTGTPIAMAAAHLAAVAWTTETLAGTSG